MTVSSIGATLESHPSPKKYNFICKLRLGTILDPNYLSPSLMYYIPNKCLINVQVQSSPEQTRLSLEELMSSLPQVAGGV